MRHVAKHQACVLKVQLCGVRLGLMVAPLSCNMGLEKLGTPCVL